MTSILAFTLFAIVASITPGPTNILVLTNSSRFGLAKSWPLILGSCSAAALIVLLTGFGLGGLLLEYSLLKEVMAWSGALWLTWMSWKLSQSDLELDSKEVMIIAGWKSGALLQIINPKTWMMALAVSSIFLGGSRWIETAMLAGIFFLVAIPCLICWAYLGVSSKKWFKSPRQQLWFNRGLSLMLLFSVWWSMWLDMV